MFKADSITIDRDLGERALLRAVDELDDAHFDVGLFEGETHPESEEYTIAQIGAVHEFGTKDGHIKERSFLRSTADEQRDAYHRRMAQVAAKVQRRKGKGNLISMLTAVGELAASDVRKKITTLRTPKKADSTIKSQGGKTTNPLIWLGYMRAAVRSRIVVGHSEKMTPKGSR